MNDKIYFQPGDIVQLRQEIPNKPLMYVVKKKTMLIKDNSVDKDFLQGIVCRWFTADYILQESVFNTKDLIKI